MNRTHHPIGRSGIDLAVPSLAQLHGRRSMKWAGVDHDVVPSTVAEMDFPVLPAISAALHRMVDDNDLGYPDPKISRLTEAFTGFAARRLGWRVDPEQVRLVPDVMVGVTELARLLAGPTRSVAFATPAHRSFRAYLPSARLVVHEVPTLDDGTIDLNVVADLFRHGTRVFLLANPHNPTGRVASRSELQLLAELCAEHGAWVIADEVHAPLVLPGASHVPWLEVSEAARSCGIALTSASKAFNLAGLKAALLVTASEPARLAVERLPALADHAGLLGVVASEVAFSQGDAWLDALLAQLDANRSLLSRLLAELIPEIVWTPPQATYLAWLDCRPLGLGEDPAHIFLERCRVALTSGSNYGHESGAGHVRLNFGTSSELVIEMVQRMSAAR